MNSAPGRQRWFYVFLNLFILLAPVNSLADALALLQGTLDKLAPQTPVVLKLYKDIYVLIAFGAIAQSAWVLRKPIFFVPLFQLAVMTVLLLWAVAAGRSDTAMLGYRSYLSIFLVLYGYLHGELDFHRIKKSLIAVLLVELGFQIVEALYAPNFYGNQILGINLRNPGTFTSTGILSALDALCLYVFGKLKMPVWQFISCISLIFTHSSTGYVLLLAYAIYLLLERFTVAPKFLYLPAIILGAVVVYPILSIITFREDVLDSLWPRVRIFESYLQYPLGLGLGFGNSAAVLSGQQGAVIADSLLAANLINAGVVGLLLTLMIYIWTIYCCRRSIYLILVFVFYSATLVIYEITPFIQLFYLILGAEIFRNEMMKRGHGAIATSNIQELPAA